MENKMGHFINWKFGIPVNVKNVGFPNFFYENVLLIYEGEGFFEILSGLGVYTYAKKDCTYELVPYRFDDVFTRYPVCQTSCDTAYSGSSGDMNKLGVVGGKLEKEIPATLNIDGKTIKLSAEITAELKKKLGL